VYIIVIENSRHRYICFIVKPTKNQFNIEKSEINNEIRLQCKNLFNKNCESMGIRLISFNGKKGIVKCTHTEKENTIKLLNSIKKISLNEADVKTIGTSGTIKTLIKKYINDDIH
jgi:RNase P/RNase MRP subunit POP5